MCVFEARALKGVLLSFINYYLMIFQSFSFAAPLTERRKTHQIKGWVSNRESQKNCHFQCASLVVASPYVAVTGSVVRFVCNKLIHVEDLLLMD